MRIFLRWSGEQQNFAFESSGSQAQTPKNTIVLRQNYLELISRLTAVVGAISEWDAHLRDSHLIPIWDFYLRFLFEILIWEHPWTPLSSSDWRSLMRCFENCALFNLDFTWIHMIMDGQRDIEFAIQRWFRSTVESNKNTLTVTFLWVFAKASGSREFGSTSG